MLYDMHCHLDRLSDLEGALSRARQAGVSFILTHGLNPSSNRAALALQEQYSFVHAALGIYPSDAVTLSDEEIDAEISFIRSQKPIAIGEIGLDYHWDDTQKERMQAVFKRLLLLAKQLDRPVVVHSRKAEQDVLSFLSEVRVRALLHCFGGRMSLVKQGVALGAYFSIPPIVLTSTHFSRMVEVVPMSRLLLETDSPYLSPSDAENEPAHVRFSLERIAHIKGLMVPECAQQLWLNKQKFLS